MVKYEYGEVAYDQLVSVSVVFSICGVLHLHYVKVVLVSQLHLEQTTIELIFLLNS